jgi:hypothetical protein
MPTEIANAIAYSAEASWTNRNLFAVLHELAHAFDLQVYDAADTSRPNGPRWPHRPTTDVNVAYEEAYNTGLHRLPDCEQTELTWWQREPCEAYALANVREYFAVMTTALFLGTGGTFTREDLPEHDPVGAAAVEAAWKIIP